MADGGRVGLLRGVFKVLIMDDSKPQPNTCKHCGDEILNLTNSPDTCYECLREILFGEIPQNACYSNWYIGGRKIVQQSIQYHGPSSYSLGGRNHLHH